MKAALITQWKAPVVGREKLALEYSVEVAEFWGKAAADGKCTEPEFFFGTNGVSYWMVKGAFDELAKLQMSETAEKLLFKGDMLLENFQYGFFRTGEAADEFMAGYFAVAGEYGFV